MMIQRSLGHGTFAGNPRGALSRGKFLKSCDPDESSASSLVLNLREPGTGISAEASASQLVQIPGHFGIQHCLGTPRPAKGKLIPAHPLEPSGQAAAALSTWEPRRAIQAVLTLGHLDPQAKQRLNRCERKRCRPGPLFGVILQGDRILGWAELGRGAWLEESCGWGWGVTGGQQRGRALVGLFLNLSSPETPRSLGLMGIKHGC